jgi:hypothetical protein
MIPFILFMRGAGARSSVFGGAHLVGGAWGVFRVVPVFFRACITGVQGKNRPLTSLIC